jgi:hypothetical protein
VAQNQGIAGIGLEQPGHHLEDGGFAGPVWPEKGIEHTLGHLQFDGIDGGVGAEGLGEMG